MSQRSLSKVVCFLFLKVAAIWLHSSANFNAASVDVGCFKAVKSLSNWSSPGNYDPEILIPDSCAILCGNIGANVAGVTNGVVCVCGNIVQTFFKSSSCDQKCAGNSSFSCGGQAAFNVYNSSVLLRNSPKLRLESKPVIFETVWFQVNLINETSSVGYLLTPAEYTEFFNEENTLMFGNRYNYTFTTWGDDVQLLVVVLEPLLQKYKETVQVGVPLKVSSLQCPSYVLVGDDFECSGRLDLGEDVNVTWTIDGLSHSLALADPVSLHVGHPAPKWIISGSGTDVASGLVLCLTSGVILPVLVHAWEMNVNRSGIVDLVVLRPSCSSELVYCPASNSCCPSNNEFLSEVCNHENSFCSATSFCADQTQQTICSFSDSAGKISLKDSYRVVYKISLNVQTGYNLKRLTADGLFEYLPGDVLGWIKTDRSATLVVDSSKGEFSILPGVTTVPESSLINLTSQQQRTKQFGTVLMAGIASKPSEFLLTLTTAYSGNRSITFIHKTPSGENLTATRSVFALDPIGNVSLVSGKTDNSCNIYGPLNEPFNVSLYVASGTIAKVHWRVENTNITNSYLPIGRQEKIEVRQNFTFSRLGKYFLAVMVSNPLGGKIIHGDIFIQEKTSGLNAGLKLRNETTYQGIKSELIASTVTGTNVTFRWYFGDGSETKVTTQGTTDHSFKKKGLITTIVEAVNMVSSENISIQINVSNPVKIILPQYGVNGSSVNITCSLPDGITHSYQVVFEVDSSSMVSSNCNTIQYTFSTGLHNISCYIQLSVVVTSNAALYVLEPITGLNIIDLSPVKLGETRLVQANITTGNNVSYLWQVLGQAYYTHLTSAKSINFSSPGSIKTSVNASNAISMHYAETLVTVEVPLGVLAINASSNPGRSNTNITFYISKTSGTFVKYTVNISNMYSLSLGSSPTFTNSFQEGIHDIVVSASNFISQSNVTYQMTVQDPLVYPINISCRYVLREDGVCFVEANRNLSFLATVNYATNVTFLWSCHDSDNQTSDEHATVKKPHIMSTVDCFFPRSEKYNVSVEAINDISFATKWLSVYSLDKIAGFSFSTPKAVAVNEPVQLQISLSKGSNVTFSFDTGDKRTLVTRLNSKKLKYTNPGIYFVNGTARNILGSEPYSRYLTVQERIKSINFTKIISVIEVSKMMPINWEIRGGSNTTTLISWGDGTHENISYISCASRESSSSYNCQKSHKFTKAGSYEINLTAQNLLSLYEQHEVSKRSVLQKVSVQDPIEGLSISPSSQSTFVHVEIDITAKITKGTDVEYQFNLGDGRMLNTSDSTVLIKYNTEDTYKLSITARNGISSQTAKNGASVDVKMPLKPIQITGLLLSVKPTVLGTPTKLEVSYTTGTLFSCTANFGEGTGNKVFTEAEVNQLITHQYPKSGRYDIILTCKNTLGDSTARTYVFVDEEIKYVHFNSSPIAAFPSTVSIDLTWKNGSNVTIVAFEDGRPLIKPVVNQNSRKSRVSFSSGYFNFPGKHEILVNASNSVSSVQEVVIIHLIERIINMRVLINPFVPVNYRLFAYLSLEKGSEIKVEWSFGDGEGIFTANCSWQKTCSKDYTYKKPGIYTITAEAVNGISKDSSEADVEIQHPVFGWTFSPVNISEKNSPSFLSLRYNSSFPFPTNACYQIKYDNKPKSGCKNLIGNASVIEKHTFSEAGCHPVGVIMTNNVSKVVLNTVVEVRGEIGDLKLTAHSLGTGMQSTGFLPVEYPVRFNSTVQNNCLKYNWTISNETKIFHVNNSVIFDYTFENAGTYNVSLTAYDTKMARNATITITVDLSVTGLFVSSDGVAEVNDSVNFVLLCATLGRMTSFKVDYGDRSAIETLPTLRNVIQDFRKEYKKLKLPFNPMGFYHVIFNHTYPTNGTYVVKVNVSDPANDQSLINEVVIAKAPCELPDIKIVGGSQEFQSAPEIPYGVQYTLFSDVSSSCEDVATEFAWTVFEADEYLLKKKNSSLPPREDLKVNLISEIRTNQSSLTIPRKTLQPRLYIFQLSSSLPNMNARNKYIVYLRVQRPPLTVIIAGGNARSVAWDKKFTLNASDSVDPMTQSSNKLQYDWDCVKKENPEISGCFGSGKNLSEFTGTKVVEFREKLLDEKFTYQFTVTVSTKLGGNTFGRYTQEIKAIPGNPPEISLSCVSNCAQMINPDSRLSIKSKCDESCSNVKYEWKLDSTTSSATTEAIWSTGNLTKRSSPNLVVKSGTFLEKHSYVFKLSATNERGKTGYASYEVKVNSPPHGGSCNFNPKKGVGTKTPFNFSCQGWKDDQNNPNQPLSYKIFYSSSVDGGYKVLLYHGPKSAVNNIILPSARGENHTFTITLLVEDVFGAYNASNFSIKVEPEGNGPDLKELRNKTSTILQNLLDTGDVQGANRLAVALMSEVKSDGQNEKVNKEKAEIFHEIVKRVSDNLPNDLDSMRQSVETVEVAVQSTANVLPETQAVAAGAFQRTSKLLQSEAKEDLGNDIVEDIAVGLLRGIGNIMQASSSTQASFRQLQGQNVTLTSENKKALDNSHQTIEMAFSAIAATTGSILEKKVNDEQRVLIESKNLEAYVKRVNFGGLESSSVSFSESNAAAIDFPANFLAKLSKTDNDLVDVVGLFLTSNPYLSYNTSKLIDSSSVSLELKQTSGSIIQIRDLDTSLEINVPRKASSDHEALVNKTETKSSELIIHVLELRSLNNAFVVEIAPENLAANFTLYFRHREAPTRTIYDTNHTFSTQKLSKNGSTPTLHYFLPNSLVNGTKCYVGVGSQINGLEAPVNYTFKSYEIGCYYWSEENRIWTTLGCTPGQNSTEKTVQCLCNHATIFGSNFFVAPNVIDVKKEILNLAKLGDYPALLAAICVTGGIYIIALVWAFKKDRRETGKVGLHVAADNDPNDTQRYEVVIFTGSRRNAGSTAEVSLIISGDQGDSKPCLMQRTSSLSYKRSSRDSYLVTTFRSLGSLLYIRVWHDNSGSDPSWFLSQIIIRDVETGLEYFFLCNSWLACDEGDGLVERLIPVASPEELKDFQYLFMQNSSQGFSDGHLWFSIILRPAQSRFSHAQRVSCCMCLLLCTMLTNAMFYEVEVAKENNVDVDIGPYEFSWHEIMVGIQSSLIVFPVNLLIVGIFRHVAARPRKSSKYLTNNGSSGKSLVNSSPKSLGTSLRDVELENYRRKAQKINEEDQHRQSHQPKTVKTTAGKKVRFLPWWFVYVAWFFLITVSLTAGFFTLLYGISFGKRKQEKWLTALVVSVFQDVLISQPFKIFAVALFVAFIIRKPNRGEVNEENEKLLRDEEWIQQSLLQVNTDGVVRKNLERKPPDELILRKTRLFRLKERKMFQVFREIIQYVFFWWIVLMIAYGYREPDAHRLTTSMEKMFVNLGSENSFAFQRDSKHDIFKAKNKRDLLMWVHDVIIPGLNHETWYNNKTDRQKGAISDGVGYLVGSARMRLLRVKKDTCIIPKIFADILDGCESEYSFSTEYQVKYNRRDWIASNESLPDIDPFKIWRYRSQSELYDRPFWADFATYRGGGYVINLEKGIPGAQQQIKELNKTWWIDGQTRVVFIEFTVFSPNKNLHCIVTVLFECPATGGCKAEFQILATRLDEFIGNYRLFVLVCELIFVVFMVSFTYKAIKQMAKEGAEYWKMFWNWIEMAIITLGWSCLAFYVLRFIANKWTKSMFHKDVGRFVNFRYVATADQLYGAILAFVVFLVSLKFLRLLRFNRRMSLLGSTLKFATWDLLNFIFMFAIAFFSCACVAYLLFHNDIDMFSSMLVTMQTLLNIILGKFKYVNFSQDTFVASALVLVVYVVVVVFVLMNVFLAILNDAFKVVKHDNDLQENEYEIVDYVTARFKSWLGFRKKPSKLKSDFEHEYGFKPTYVPFRKMKYQLPATVVLDRKVQELSDFVDKQEYSENLEDLRINEFDDENTKKKALLLLIS